jgi:hypothetical protein
MQCHLSSARMSLTLSARYVQYFCASVTTHRHHARHSDIRTVPVADTNTYNAAQLYLSERRPDMRDIGS